MTTKTNNKITKIIIYEQHNMLFALLLFPQSKIEDKIKRDGVGASERERERERE